MPGCRVYALAWVALLVSVSEPSPAAGPLAPTGPWTLDYAENQCNASRTYGQADDPVLFAIRPAPNGATYELLFGKGQPGPRYAEELRGRVDFGRGPIKAWLLHYGAKPGKSTFSPTASARMKWTRPGPRAP